METSRVGIAAADLMEDLEQLSEDHEVREAVVIAEVADEEGSTFIVMGSSTDSRVYMTGLFEWAKKSIGLGGDSHPFDPDDPE